MNKRKQRNVGDAVCVPVTNYIEGVITDTLYDGGGAPRYVVTLLDTEEQRVVEEHDIRELQQTTTKRKSAIQRAYHDAYCMIVEAVYKAEEKHGIPLALTALAEVLSSRVEAEWAGNSPLR